MKLRSITKILFLVLMNSRLGLELESRAEELPVSSGTERAPLVLGVGEQRVLRLKNLKRFSVGSGVIRTRVLKDSGKTSEGQELLLVKGAAPGMSDLWVWNSDGPPEHRTIRVMKISTEELKPALERELGRLEEAEILYSGTGVVLRGEIRSIAECARIDALKQGFPKEIVDYTEPSELLLRDAQKALTTWASAVEPGLKVELSGRVLWMRGTLSRPSAQESVVKKIKAIYPKAELEIASLPDGAPTVHFKVFLLELKKNRFASLGLSWPASQEGAFRVTTSKIEDLLQLDLTLQALEGDGSVRILSNPELVVRAPGDAELFSGGELPIEVSNRFAANVLWKTFGLTLSLKVTHTTSEKVRLDIFTEVSHLDPTLATGSGKIPGLQANRMKTQVDARYGTPLLLSGLLQQGMHEQARGLPMLRDIPVLGQLFGSEDYLNERSELVAILLPSLAPPEPPMERVESLYPKGHVPPPRNWVSPHEEAKLREQPGFPWSALE